MSTDYSDIPIEDRLRRLMRLGGEAASEDPDVEAWEMLDVVSKVPGDDSQPGIYAEMHQWHLWGRPDEQAAHPLIRRKAWERARAHAEAGDYPLTIVDATDDLEDRLEDAEYADDDDA